MCDDTPDGTFLEVGKLILGISWIEELDPLDRVSFEVDTMLFPFCMAHVLVNRSGAHDVFLVFLPINKGIFIDLLHFFDRFVVYFKRITYICGRKRWRFHAPNGLRPGLTHSIVFSFYGIPLIKSSGSFGSIV